MCAEKWPTSGGLGFGCDGGLRGVLVEDRAEHVVPELARDPVPEVMVLVVVVQVVCLQLPEVGQKRLPAVVEVVVCEVVEHVAGEAAGEEAVCLGLGEGCAEGGVDRAGEEGGEDGGEDEAHGVHGEEVVDAVQQKVQRDAPPAELHPLVEVEEPAVEGVLEQRPHKDSRHEPEEDGKRCDVECSGVGQDADHDRHPDCRHRPPRCAGEELEEV
mmetsp:Transcript_44553/g.89405  ORF Transcript_44553/g.89405 Transcript_44553/m.89405 type:complete len:214 (-) Transcript_44553:315-956(-)